MLRRTVPVVLDELSVRQRSCCSFVVVEHWSEDHHPLLHGSLFYLTDFGTLWYTLDSFMSRLGLVGWFNVCISFHLIRSLQIVSYLEASYRLDTLATEKKNLGRMAGYEANENTRDSDCWKSVGLLVRACAGLCIRCRPETPLGTGVRCIGTSTVHMRPAAIAYEDGQCSSGHRREKAVSVTASGAAFLLTLSAHRPAHGTQQ